MVKAKAVIYLSIPDGTPVKDKNLTVKEIDVDTDNVPENGAVLKVLSISLDPYMRGRMRDTSVKSYNKAFEPGQVLEGFAVAVVQESKNDKFTKGQIVTGSLKHQEYIATDDLKMIRPVPNKHKLPLEHFLGVLGMPGMTAYSSLYKIGEPKKGQTILVTAASGAVGSIVGQLAKREGMYVVGSAGSDDKVKYLLDELKFDAAFNYKKEKPADAIPKYCKDGLDIFYDNVGGETLDAALMNANPFARFVMCGAISQYNLKPDEKYGVKNLPLVIGRKIKMQGFIVQDFGMEYLFEAVGKMEEMIHNGELSYKEDVSDGIEHEIDGFIGMLEGKNFGKKVIKYADN